MNTIEEFIRASQKLFWTFISVNLALRSTSRCNGEN